MIIMRTPMDQSFALSDEMDGYNSTCEEHQRAARILSKASERHASVRRQLMIESVRCIALEPVRTPGNSEAKERGEMTCTLVVHTAWLSGAAQERRRRGSAHDDDDDEEEKSLDGSIAAYSVQRMLTDVVDLSMRLMASFDVLLSPARGGPTCLADNPAMTSRSRLWTGGRGAARQLFGSLIMRRPATPNGLHDRQQQQQHQHARQASGEDASTRKLCTAQRAAIDDFFRRALNAGGEVVASSRALQDFFLQETMDEPGKTVPPPVIAPTFPRSSSPTTASIRATPTKRKANPPSSIPTSTRTRTFRTSLAFLDGGAGKEVQAIRKQGPSLWSKMSTPAKSALSGATRAGDAERQRPSSRQRTPTLNAAKQDTTASVSASDAAVAAKRAQQLTKPQTDQQHKQVQQSLSSPSTASARLTVKTPKAPSIKSMLFVKSPSSMADDEAKQWLSKKRASIQSLATPTSLRQHKGGIQSANGISGAGSGRNSATVPTPPSPSSLSLGQHSMSSWRTFQENNVALAWLSVDSSRSTSIASVDSDVIENLTVADPLQPPTSPSSPPTPLPAQEAAESKKQTRVVNTLRVPEAGGIRRALSTPELRHGMDRYAFVTHSQHIEPAHAAHPAPDTTDGSSEQSDVVHFDMVIVAADEGRQAAVKSKKSTPSLIPTNTRRPSYPHEATHSSRDATRSNSFRTHDVPSFCSSQDSCIDPIITTLSSADRLPLAPDMQRSTVSIAAAS